MPDTSVGYIYSTGSGSSDPAQFQQLVTIDAPTTGSVISSCKGRQGVYFLSGAQAYDPYGYYSPQSEYYIHVLPQPDNLTDIKYASAPKMEYVWRSKKFVMPGRATMGAGKVVHSGGRVRVRIFIDGCCRHEQQVRSNKPFRLPPQMMGVEWEIELTGTATVYEAHIAPSMQELVTA